MSFGMKVWGPAGKEIFQSESTAAMQLAATWFGMSVGGEQGFPEFAGKEMFVTAAARAAPIYPGILEIVIDYNNGWPLVKWHWVYLYPFAVPMSYTFYAFTR